MNDVVPLLKFTPSAQDPEILETITVQRESLIGKLVEVALDSEGGARHQLLIGPRGIGKTHILSLVASRVQADASSDSVTLAWLEEDPWSITSYEKFLAAVVARVADELSDAALAERADQLRAGRDQSGGEAEQALRDALGELRLVLLAENLDDIFRRIGKNGQERFRAFVENWQRMVIVATAPQLFEGVQLHESPFYGFFAITHLDELSLESATELMRRIAELREDSDLVAFLGTDVAAHRLAAIEALAGGHPRIWLLLSGCVSIKAIDDLVPLFLEALDDLTPYYQDRLRELGDQQQELVVLLSEAGGALSNRELAERSGIAQNQIATMLRQLTDRGYVRRAEVPGEIARGDARMSYWELREPLMRLCLDVKQARGKPLRMVVEFLRAWYGPRLLDELATLPSSARLATSYVSEAFRTLEGPLPVETLFRGSSSEVLARVELGLSLSPERPDLRAARLISLLLSSEFEEARQVIDALEDAGEGAELRSALARQMQVASESDHEPSNLDGFSEGLMALGDEKPDGPLAQYVVAMGLHWFARNEDAVKAFPRAIELSPSDGVLHACYARSLGSLGRYQEALDGFFEAQALEPGNASHHANRAVALQQLGRPQEALEAIEKAVELKPERSAYRMAQAGILESVERREEAVDTIAQGAEFDPDNAELHGIHGVILRRLERYDEALQAFARAAELDPENAFYRERMGVALDRLGRYEEALIAFDRAVELNPDSAAMQSNRGAALAAMERHESALEAFKRAAELDPEDPELQSNLGAALMGLDRFEEALAVFQAIDDTFGHPFFFFNLSVALSHFGRYEEALSAVDQALDLKPSDTALWLLKGEILENLDRFEGAWDAIEQASVLAPTDAEPLGRKANLQWLLGRPDEAEESLEQAIECDPHESAYVFSLGVVSLARGRAEEALARLRQALAVWSKRPEGPPGDLPLLYRFLWAWAGDGMTRKDLIDDLVAAYDEVGAAEHLGRGLVGSIRWIADPEIATEKADAWTEDWIATHQVDDLEIPLRLLRAASGWKKDRDRSHLLDLPVEQREILIELIGAAGADAPGPT